MKLHEIKPLKENQEKVRSPTDAEYKRAQKYMADRGKRAHALGVDKKTGVIHAQDGAGAHYTIDPLKEGFEDPSFTPEEAERLMHARTTGDPAAWDEVEELEGKLYRIFLDSGEMPYGVAKARTGDPSNWIADRLERMSDVEFAGFVRNNTAQAAPRLARGKGLGA